MAQAGFKPNLIHGFYSDFTPEQIKHIRECLGHIPNGEMFGCFDSLIERWRLREVGMFYVRSENEHTLGGFAFYQVDQLTNGNCDFVILATVSNDESAKLTLHGISQLEKFARALGCQSLSLRTVRPGLVKTIVENCDGWFASEIILRRKLN